MTRGQEIFGICVIDVDSHDYMTLISYNPSTKSFEEMDYNHVEWRCQNMSIIKEQL